MPFDLKKAKNMNFGNSGAEKEKFLTEDVGDHENVKDGSPSTISWTAPEYEVYEKSISWYLTAALILFGIAAYAMFTNSPIMAITFILIGVVGYLHLQKEPRVLDFSITSDGVRAGNEMYEFENIESFWIFYDPPRTKTLSLHTKASFMPFVHIPLNDEDPVLVREILLKFASEEKQEAGFIDALERFLHI